MAMAPADIEVYGKVEQVNALLLAQEPGNISEDEYSHYTGYKPQSIKDAMNKVFGLGKWGFNEISNETTKDDSGKSIVIAKVKVWIAGVEWQPEAWGQARIMRGDIGDSFKSAETDAMKKGLSNFSIGNRAYLGLLPGKKEQAEQARNANGNARQSEQHPKPAPQATNAAPRQAQARTQATPAAAKPAEQQPANGTQARVDAPPIERIMASANRVLGEGGYASLKGAIIGKHNLGDIADGDIPANIRLEMADMLREEAAKKPATVGATSGK